MDPYLNRDLKKKIYIKFMEGNNRSHFFKIYYGTFKFFKLNILCIYMIEKLKFIIVVLLMVTHFRLSFTYMFDGFLRVLKIKYKPFYHKYWPFHHKYRPFYHKYGPISTNLS